MQVHQHDADAGFFKSPGPTAPFADPFQQAVTRASENDPAPRVHDPADFLFSRFPGEGRDRSRSPGAASLGGWVCVLVRDLPRAAPAQPPQYLGIGERVSVVPGAWWNVGVPHRGDRRMGIRPGRWGWVLKLGRGNDVPVCRVPERFRTFFGIHG